MLEECVRSFGDWPMWDWKLDAATARNTYLKSASRSARGNKSKKSNRLHVSRRTKAKHRRT